MECKRGVWKGVWFMSPLELDRHLAELVSYRMKQ